MAALAREGLRVERSDSDCLIAATDRLAAEVAQPDTLGVLLTASRGGRAVPGESAAGRSCHDRRRRRRGRRGSAAVGANLLVADPRAGTFLPVEADGGGVLPRRGPPLPGRFSARD